MQFSADRFRASTLTACSYLLYSFSLWTNGPSTDANTSWTGTECHAKREQSKETVTRDGLGPWTWSVCVHYQRMIQSNYPIDSENISSNDDCGRLGHFSSHWHRLLFIIVYILILISFVLFQFVWRTITGLRLIAMVVPIIEVWEAPHVHRWRWIEINGKKWSIEFDLISLFLNNTNIHIHRSPPKWMNQLVLKYEKHIKNVHRTFMNEYKCELPNWRKHE